MEFTRDELKLICQLVQSFEDETQDEKASYEYGGVPPTEAILSNLEMCDRILQTIEKKLRP